MPKPALFDDAGPTDSIGGFSVNSKFAERYESRKRKQELARARELGIDVAAASSEESESEDDGAALTSELDKQVRATIELIRNKDPRVYDSSVAFFGEPVEDADVPKPDGGPLKKKKKKKTAGDVLREQLVDAAARGAEDAFDEDDEDADLTERRGMDVRPAKAYDAQQEALRRAFIETVNSDAALAEGDLLEPRPKARKGGRKGAAAAAAEEEEEEGDEVTREELQRLLRSKASQATGARILDT
jgi:hypothetical protein